MTSDYAQVDIGSSRVTAALYADEWGFTAWTLANAPPVAAEGFGFDSAESALRVGIDALRLALEEERRRSREWSEARK